MSRSLFLFGDQHDNFAETSRPFVEAAGGRAAKIAVLTAGGPKVQPYVARITAPWHEMGVEVVTVGPEEYAGEPHAQMAQAIRQCAGIFMCGGETRHLQRMYVASALGGVIRDMYAAGIPFAGVSAGALLAAEQCAAWGGIVTASSNEYYVRGVVYQPLPDAPKSCLIVEHEFPPFITQCHRMLPVSLPSCDLSSFVAV